MCQTCFDNCGKSLTSDICVKYTGEDITDLGICQGDSLHEIIDIVFEQLSLKISQSTTFTTTTSCSFIDTILGGKSKTLQNLIDAIIQGECTLKSLYDSISAIVNAPFVVPASCLTLPSNPTRDNVLSALVTIVCSLQSDLNIIKADYVKATQLNVLIAQYLQSIGITPGSPTGLQNAKYPEYVALPYHGPLSNFSSTGTGLGNYDKLYICLGQTVSSSSGPYTLPDYRGRSPIGSNMDFTLSNIDVEVNPTLAANAGYNISQNTKKGAFTHALSSLENGQHNHPVTVNPHNHILPWARSDFGNSGIRAGGDAVMDGTLVSANSGIDITISDSGAGNPHNTTHPVIGAPFVMYVP